MSKPGVAGRLRFGRFLGLFLGLLILLAGTWGALALFVSGPSILVPRWAWSFGFGFATLAALVALATRRWRSLSLYGLLFGVVLAWYFSIAPMNDRDWVAQNAVLPHATVDGDIVTVHNIRNFSYRTETDFTPAYRDARFDLRQLEAVDLVASYWMGPHIAHVFLSFAFAGGEHLAVSIEARNEKGEGYSTLNGFFRQYELYYVVADERDLIGLRTNIRRDPPEQVYLYRVNGSPQAARRLFLETIDQINTLATRPAFYNSLTTNCTTSIWLNSRVNSEHLPFSWKILASGHVPEYLYDNGRLAAGDLPFAEVRRRALVNAHAQAAGTADDFSRLIRRNETAAEANGATSGPP
jgi:Domain of unknown function (DUF4105)